MAGLPIVSKLRNHSKIAYNKYENLLGVFAYGSINYNLYIDKKSDIDTKAIYIPTFEDIFYNELKGEELKIDKEICNIKDIRKMIKEYSKGSFDTLQLLFTSYYIIPDNDYRILWEEYFLKNRDKIVLSQSYEVCKNMAGQAYDIATKNINQWDGKKISDVLRFYHTINKYIKTRDFNYAIYFKDDYVRNELIKIKTSSEKPEDFNQVGYDYAVFFCENLKNMDKEDFCNYYHFDINYINSLKEKIDLTLKEGTKKILAKKGIF